MPELPDLTVFAKNLNKRVPRRRIVKAQVHYPHKVNVTDTAFSVALLDAEVCEILRDGKELCFQISNGHAFSVHLMLNGRFIYARRTRFWK